MRVLVTGASGLLGSHIASALSQTADVTGVDRHAWWGDSPLRMIHADLGDPAAARDLVHAERPDLLFHCAALVNVDACEQAPDAAFAANAAIPARLAESVAPDCLFVYITTDGVFPGDVAFADETVPPAPRTVYGRSKLEGERAVAAAAANHLIVRTNFFGWSSGRKQTSGEWLFSALERQASITLFDDFYFTPIYVADMIGAMLRLIDAGARGILHLTGSDRVSKYQFGMELARQAGFATDSVRRGSIDDAHLAATRPKDMSLSNARASGILGERLEGYREGISRFLTDRGRPLSARASVTAHRGSRL